MEIIRIEETQRYGYLLKGTDFEKFFDDAITGDKIKTLECLKKYLINAPKLFPNRETFKTDEFKTFIEDIKKQFDLTEDFIQFNELRIKSLTNRVKIKSGIKTSFWELVIIDQNNITHTFDYDIGIYVTKSDVITAFNTKYNLNLILPE